MTGKSRSTSAKRAAPVGAVKIDHASFQGLQISAAPIQSSLDPGRIRTVFDILSQRGFDNYSLAGSGALITGLGGSQQVSIQPALRQLTFALGSATLDSSSDDGLEMLRVIEAIFPTAYYVFASAVITLTVPITGLTARDLLAQRFVSGPHSSFFGQDIPGFGIKVFLDNTGGSSLAIDPFLADSSKLFVTLSQLRFQQFGFPEVEEYIKFVVKFAQTTALEFLEVFFNGSSNGKVAE